MPDSAAIGANFSNYTGNAALGGATGQLLDIDTRPLQQLAAYTNLYNQTLWKQRQADTDAKVNQLADLSKISLNDLRGKDKEQATKEFSDLLNYASEYARKTPATSQEKIQQQLEWQTKYGAFLNNFTSGKQRAVAYQAHVNTIMNNTTDASLQDVKLKELNSAFDSTDIGTPISALPQFKMEDISIPKPVVQDIDIVDINGDQNVNAKFKSWNPTLNGGNVDATILGLKKAYPQKGTPEYDSLTPNEQQQAEQQVTVESQGKIWNDMTIPLNAAIKKYTDADGNFNAKQFENDNASNSTLMRAYNALKQMDTYSKDHYNQAVNGIYEDKGLQYKLPSNVNANDYKAGYVDFSKGVSAHQLGLAGVFSQFEGDSVTKVVTETGKATQLQIAKLNRISAERINANTQSNENYRKSLDLIGQGWTKDAKGKLQPPAKNAATTATNNGIVPYWENYIVPQITSSPDIMKKTTTSGMWWWKKTDTEDVPKDFTGDIEVEPDKISGLSIALTGEKTADGTGVGLDKTSPVSIRLKNGVPIGVVINGVFYDQNNINSKATQLNDKSVSNKQDANIYQTTPVQPTLTQAQKFLQGLK